ERLCDAVVVTFALWTVCCHAIVAAGRALVALLVLFAVVLGASLWLRRRLRPAPAMWDAVHTATPEGPSLWWLGIAALAVTAGAVLRFAVGCDVVQLWWIAVVLLGIAAGAVCFTDATRISPPERDRASEMLLWVLAAAAVVVTLISHRPDT